MTPVQPHILHEGGRRRVFGTGQPEYTALPASVDAEGTVMTEWECSAEDLACLVNGGRVRLWLLYTGVEKGRPLTPIAIETVEGVREEAEIEDRRQS